MLGGGVYGNWYYADESLLIRVLALLGGTALAVFIAIQTERGRNTWNLIKEARSEIRRVVWPSNQETTQTTLVVLLLVFVFALILWGLDSLLSWFVSSVIG
jgi:preprotein translocase subunit SecE